MDWLSSFLAASSAAFVLWVFSRPFATPALDSPNNARRPPNKYAPVELEYTNAALLREMTATWTRPTDKLPLGADLPRLARKISLRADDGTALMDGAHYSDEQRVEILRDLLLRTAAAVGDSPDALRLERFEPLLQSSSDLSYGLGIYFNECIDQQSATLRLLKACNQALVASALIRLKRLLNDCFPFHDVRGQWHIGVTIGGQSVTVVHTKREASFESAQFAFEFEWRLEMRFDGRVEHMTAVDFSIARIDWPLPNADAQRRFADTLRPHDFVRLPAAAVAALEPAAERP